MGKKIKILFAINCLNIGGAPHVVYEQFNSLDKEKFDPYILLLYKSKKFNYLKKINSSKFGTDRVVQFNLKNRSILDFKTWRGIFLFLKEQRFDIVYTHLFLSNLVVRLLAIITRVPIIFSFEHSTYFNKRLWQKMADKFLSFFTTKILVAIQAVAEFTSKQEKIPLTKFFVLPNPVSLPNKNNIDLDFWKKNLGIKENSFVVLNIGRFSEVKAQDYFIEIAEKICKTNQNFIFILAGHGPLKKELEKMIFEKGLESSIKLVVEPDRVKELFYLADIFVLPSKREGQSLVTYESLMAGVPVIASKLDSLAEIIKDQENGYLVNVGDVTGFTERILELYHKPNLRLTMAEKGIGSVREYQKQNAGKFERLILESYNNKYE